MFLQYIFSSITDAKIVHMYNKYIWLQNETTIFYVIFKNTFYISKQH
jgi:hypothetical protein